MRRPDVVQAERLLVAANADIGAAKALFYPTISLTGVRGIGQRIARPTSCGPTRIVWSLGAGLLQPIFNGSRIKHNYEAARARYDQALGAVPAGGAHVVPRSGGCPRDDPETGAAPVGVGVGRRGAPRRHPARRARATTRGCPAISRCWWPTSSCSSRNSSWPCTRGDQFRALAAALSVTGRRLAAGVTRPPARRRRTVTKPLRSAAASTAVSTRVQLPGPPIPGSRTTSRLQPYAPESPHSSRRRVAARYQRNLAASGRRRRPHRRRRRHPQGDGLRHHRRPRRCKWACTLRSCRWCLRAAGHLPPAQRQHHHHHRHSDGRGTRPGRCPAASPAELAAAGATLAILVGVILVLASLLRLGFVANFISDPVLAGFKSGIGVVIVVDQIPKLLGIHIQKAGFFRDLVAMARTPARDARIPTLLLAAGHPRAAVRPGALRAAGAGAAHRGGRGDRGLRPARPAARWASTTVGDIPRELPSLVWPNLGLAGAMWPGAVGHRAHEFHREHRRRAGVRARPASRARCRTRNCWRLALANALGGLFGAMPAGGGTSQTAVNRRAGARTQMAELVTAAAALATLLLLGPVHRADAAGRPGRRRHRLLA